jgi:hypothetical protein
MSEQQPGAGAGADADSDAGGEGPLPSGRWWDAEIVADAGSPDAALDCLYARRGLWERYTVRWLGVEGVPPDDPSLLQEVSPWELFPAGTTTRGALLEEPSRLPPADRARLLAALRAARREKRWRLFRDAPGPDDSWADADKVQRPYNREVALPIGLDTLEVRRFEALGPFWQFARLAACALSSSEYSPRCTVLRRAAPARRCAVLLVPLHVTRAQTPAPPPPQSRLDLGYYRSLEGFKADANLIAMNAAGETAGLGCTALAWQAAQPSWQFAARPLEKRRALPAVGVPLAHPFAPTHRRRMGAALT